MENTMANIPQSLQRRRIVISGLLGCLIAPISQALEYSFNSIRTPVKSLLLSGRLMSQSGVAIRHVMLDFGKDYQASTDADGRFMVIFPNADNLPSYCTIYQQQGLQAQFFRTSQKLAIPLLQFQEDHDKWLRSTVEIYQPLA
jgi:hypothetical protein